MGRSYLYECPRCGYRARVAGGVSDGAWFAVQTVRCADCRELHDAVVKMKVAVPPPAELRRNLGIRNSLSLARLLGITQPPTLRWR